MVGPSPDSAETLTKSAGVIDPDHMVIVVVGDRKLVEAPLVKLGYQVTLAPPELSE